jgi:hypothetical protein
VAAIVPGFSDSLPSLLLVRVFVPLAHLHAHPFPLRSHSFHFLTGISVPPAVILSLFHIRALFLFSIALRQYPALFPSAHSVLELCRSLSRFHSQLAPLALFPHYVPCVSLSTPSTHLKYFSCTPLHLLLFFPSPDFRSVHQYALYHALEHHHSPPELTSPLSLSYSPHASNYLVRLPHYLSHLRLVCGSLIKGVSQVLEFAHSFYLVFFPLPLALLTLPLSLVEDHYFRLLNIHFQLFLPHILSQVLHHFVHLSLSFFATITMSFANARLQTFSTTTPPACAFLNISSTSATYIVNSKGLSGQPGLTPFVVLNHSPSFSPIFTLYFVHPYISSTFRTNHSPIPLPLSHTLKHFLCVHLIERRPEVQEQCAHPPLLLFQFAFCQMVQDVHTVHSAPSLFKSGVAVRHHSFFLHLSLHPFAQD